MVVFAKDTHSCMHEYATMPYVFDLLGFVFELFHMCVGPVGLGLN
jgi:hypothetical protein